MWVLNLLGQLNLGTMTEMGLKLTAEDIYSVNTSSLKDAVVRFGRGCTGEIISDKGLVLTNHHCGYSRIQAHSTVKHDYLKDGFWAGSPDEELPNPGLTVTFLKEIRDVTDQVLESVDPTMNEKERSEAIARKISIIQAEAAEGSPYSARVSSFYGGNQYCLYLYEVFSDVRFVGAPPSSIGKFGYDTDNWMWPRHTGDFSLFRVYTAPDGSPANYDAENIPLKPETFLPVSTGGYEVGDFSMVLGYSGSTERYMTSWEIDELLGVTHPNRIKIRGARQEIIWKAMMSDESIRIKYASKYSGSSNYWKFSIGQSQGLVRLHVKKKKEARQQEFTQWVNADPARQESYGHALELIRNSVEGRKDLANARQYISECLLRGCELLSFAYRHYGLFETLAESGQPGGDAGGGWRMTHEIAYAKRDMDNFYKDYEVPLDRKVTGVMLGMFAADIPKKFWPDELVALGDKYKGDWQKATGKMFSGSVLKDRESFASFLANPDLKTLRKDPLFRLAGSVRSDYNEILSRLSDFDTDYTKGHRLYVAGLLEMDRDRIHYPDANSTMRLTYGTVGGYSPRDAVKYMHYTTLRGVMEKEDPDNFEFRVDDRLKELYNKKDFGRYGEDSTMHVCFTTNNDITGGNSGSPVLNGKGELMGIAFDGNWEAMSGDIIFEQELQKCICVDIRYVLFVIDKFAGAHNIIDELELR